MRKMKTLGKGSFLKSVLRALGMDRSSALPSMSHAETKPGFSMSYPSHAPIRTALLEAEKAKVNAIMELRRRSMWTR